MIVRKPYAFLIKNFRLIHFFMLLVSSYILYRTSIAYTFFKDYASTRQFIDSETLINDTLPIIMVFLSIFMIFASVTIFILFKKKDKPTLVYILSTICYTIFIFFVVISRGMITTIIIDGLDPRIARIMRDIWLISLIVEIVLVGFYLIRALGFDVKKFNFGEDLNELKIEDEDSEEIELTTGFDKDKLKVKMAMQKEEFKSFYYENRFIIIIILILLFVVIPGAIIAKHISDNTKFAEKEVINLKNFQYTILSSSITKKNSKGETVFKGDSSFLIVKFNIKNLSEEARGLKLNNMRIEANGNVYSPNVTYYEVLSDFGKGYTGQEISKESKDYIVVYVVKDEDMKGEVVFRYADKITVKDNEASATYHRIVLKPTEVDVKSNSIVLEEGQTFTVPNGNINFTIKHSNIKDKYTYEVNDKTKYIVNNYGLVLCIEYEYSSENNVEVSEFLSTYAYIKYTVDGKTEVETITDITPKNYNKNEVYLSVKEAIKDASSVELVFDSRNTEYIYKIK